MSLTMLIVLAVLLLVVGLAVSTGTLWVICRVLKFPISSWGRCLVTCIIITVLQVTLSVTELWLAVWLGKDLIQASVITAVGWAALSLVIPWIAIHRRHRVSLRKAAFAVLAMIGVSGVVSLSLAFTLRGFLVEGFVVPTGAMAPAIYGMHAEIDCDNCGFPYNVSLSDRMDHITGAYRSPFAKEAFCPNCGQPHLVDQHAWLHDGDRLLVEKISQPNRWDLLVFRYPVDPKFNYVKRLVGLPNESLEIHGGELFINGQWLRKAPGKQPELWLLVHDSRYVPAREAQRRWKADSPSWQVDANGRFRFEENGEAELRFEGEILDRLAYNVPNPDDQATFMAGRPAPAATAVSPAVNDVRVDCRIANFTGDGSVRLQWQVKNAKVSADLRSDGSVALASITATGQEKRSTSVVLPGGWQQNSLIGSCIRDGQAYLRVAGQVIGLHEFAGLGVKDAQDTVGGEPCQLTITATDCAVEFDWIRVWRDVYYRRMDEMSLDSGLRQPYRIGQNEFFVLGDNSVQSKDARFWGVVPGDNIIGISRWTYWPRDRWRTFR